MSATFASQPAGHPLNFLFVLVIAAAIFAAIAGMLIGLPTLRLRGDYIAIVTLAFGEIIGRIAVNGDERSDRRPRRSPPAARASRRSTRSTCRGLDAVRHALEPQAVVLASRSRSCWSCCS